MKNQNQEPPKGFWWALFGVGAWELYNNWPKPNVSIPNKKVQPSYKPLPMTPYNLYFINRK